MRVLKFNLYDNYIVYLFFIFLAFSYALTFKLGFPLKISEIALGIILILFLIKKRFRLYALNLLPNKILLAFITLTAVSTIINLFWNYDYDLKQFDSRFGYKIDSILKMFYVVLAYFAFLLSTNALSINKRKYLDLFLIGAVVAAVYGWYLFLSSLAGLPYLILPGMDTPLQTFYLFGQGVVRNGTFLEGNYMGLFLLISGIVAIYHQKTKLAVFLLLSIVTTVSTMAISCLILFLGLHFFKKYFTKKHLPKLIFIFVAGLITLSLLSINQTFRDIVIDKLTGSTEKLSNASFSKADRLNSTYAALNMGLSNPFIGVGISNYALHYERYNTDRRFADRDFKVIPNNVYTEIFAELGIFSFILFLCFIASLFKIASNDQTGVLRNGLIVLSIYLLTFPTFTLLFIWFYFGLIASVKNG